MRHLRAFVLAIASFVLVLGVSAFGSLPPIHLPIPLPLAASPSPAAPASPSAAPCDPSVTFDPNSVSGLVAWYDASQIGGLSDGDPIGTWSDLSANANDLTASSTARPTYVASAGWCHGLPVARFDGTANKMVQASNMTLDSYHYFFVTNLAPAHSISALFGRRPVNTGEEFYWTASNQQWSFVTERAGTASNISTFSPWGEGVHLIEYFYDQSEIGINLDGGNLTTAAFAPGADSLAAKMAIGALSASNGYYMAGDYAELLVYNDRITGTDLDNIEFYLTQKWGTPTDFSLLQHPDTAGDLMWKAAVVEQAGWWRF